MSHSVGSCGGLWRVAAAGVMVDGGNYGGVWEVVRYILVGALERRAVTFSIYLNRSVDAFIHNSTLLYCYCN